MKLITKTGIIFDRIIDLTMILAAVLLFPSSMILLDIKSPNISFPQKKADNPTLFLTVRAKSSALLNGLFYGFTP